MRTIAFPVATLVLALAGPVTWAGGNPEAGKEKAATCVACHGETGVSPTPAFPSLAGQHASYIVAALRQYKSGDRTNPVMAAFVTALTDEDIEDLAAFYAAQEGLVTPTPD